MVGPVTGCHQWVLWRATRRKRPLLSLTCLQRLWSWLWYYHSLSRPHHKPTTQPDIYQVVLRFPLSCWMTSPYTSPQHLLWCKTGLGCEMRYCHNDEHGAGLAVIGSKQKRFREHVNGESDTVFWLVNGGSDTVFDSIVNGAISQQNECIEGGFSWSQ